MPSLPPALKEACTTADISAMLHSMHAASHHPAPWLSPSAAFLLGAVACLACLLAGWVTLQRSSSLRAKLEGLAKAAREGLSPATLSSLFGGDLPAWLAYPDVSRMEWANVALKGLWPQIDAAATKWAVLDGNLEPLLNGTTFWRPAWLASSGISVKGLALGNQPPVITGVRAYARDEDTCTDRVMVDFHFTWSSKMEGEFMAACAWRGGQMPATGLGGVRVGTCHGMQSSEQSGIAVVYASRPHLGLGCSQPHVLSRVACAGPLLYASDAAGPVPTPIFTSLCHPASEDGHPSAAGECPAAHHRAAGRLHHPPLHRQGQCVWEGGVAQERMNLYACQRRNPTLTSACLHRLPGFPGRQAGLIAVRVHQTSTPRACYAPLASLSVPCNTPTQVFVKDLVVSGTLRTQLRPLLNEIPVVGAAKVSFLGTPVFSYKV